MCAEFEKTINLTIQDPDHWKQELLAYYESATVLLLGRPSGTLRLTILTENDPAEHGFVLYLELPNLWVSKIRALRNGIEIADDETTGAKIKDLTYNNDTGKEEPLYFDSFKRLIHTAANNMDELDAHRPHRFAFIFLIFVFSEAARNEIIQQAVFTMLHTEYIPTENPSAYERLLWNNYVVMMKNWNTILTASNHPDQHVLTKEDLIAYCRTSSSGEAQQIKNTLISMGYSSF